jgi:hypothetical protein
MSDLMAQYNTYRLERIRLIAEEDHVPDQERMCRIRAVLGADLNSPEVLAKIAMVKSFVPAAPEQQPQMKVGWAHAAMMPMQETEPCRPFLARSQPQVASYEYRDDGADGEIP